jgi:hypothetical protein
MDRSEHLARRTCEHVMNRVGGRVGTAFQGGLFRESGSALKVWGGYRMEFIDEGACVRIGFSDGKDIVNKLVGKLTELKVPRKYSEVIRDVDVRSGNGELFIDLYLKHGTEGGTNNLSKLFYAVYNVGVKPAFGAILNLKE